jgi:hypothetical protein
MAVIRWRTREELLKDIPGPVLVKVDRGGELAVYEIFPFAFGPFGVEWRERDAADSWRLLAWVPMAELDDAETLRMPRGGS